MDSWIPSWDDIPPARFWGLNRPNDGRGGWERVEQRSSRRIMTLRGGRKHKHSKNRNVSRKILGVVWLDIPRSPCFYSGTFCIIVDGYRSCWEGREIKKSQVSRNFSGLMFIFLIWSPATNLLGDDFEILDFKWKASFLGTIVPTMVGRTVSPFSL